MLLWLLGTSNSKGSTLPNCRSDSNAECALNHFNACLAALLVLLT